MFPWVYGFSWQTGNMIFLTIFYSVLATIITTLVVAAVRASRDLKSGCLDEIRWHVDFSDLPDYAKSCRHTFTGNAETWICRNGFDCRTCERHKGFSRIKQFTPISSSETYSPCKVFSILGLDMPSDRLYHRGHTWVGKETGGTLVVGLDDFGRRIIGKSSIAELPPIGTRLSVNGTGWYFRNGASKTRVLSPVDGEVISKGGDDKGFYLRVHPVNDCDLRHLLKGTEIIPWMTREIERLEVALGAEVPGVSLADGGELVEDVHNNYPEADWENILAEIFLET